MTRSVGIFAQLCKLRDTATTVALHDYFLCKVVWFCFRRCGVNVLLSPNVVDASPSFAGARLKLC